MNRRKMIIAAVLLSLIFAFVLTSGVSAEYVRHTGGRDSDIVLLLDCTDAVSDVAENLADAARLFVGLLPENSTRVSVVAFGNTWDAAYSFTSDALSGMNDVMGEYARTRVCLGVDMTPTDSAEGRERIMDAISHRLSEGRYTHTNAYVGGGLMAALDMISEYGSDDASIVLVTTGRLSGFDSTDGVEWKRTNSELCADAAAFAAENGIRIFPVELNTDSKNSSGSAARSLLTGLAKDTGGASYVVSENSFGAFADSFASVLSDITGAKVSDGKSAALSELSTEVSLVVKGKADSVKAGGMAYSSGKDDDSARFVSEGGYTLVKLFAPFSGQSVDFDFSGGDSFTVVTNKPDVVLELDHGSPATRNTMIPASVYLACPKTLSPLIAPEFYKDAKLSFKMNGSALQVSKSDDKFRSDITLGRAGEYSLSAELDGFGRVGTVVEAVNYGLELSTGERGYLTRGETITLYTYFTGADGRITDPDLYLENEAFLTVSRDGAVISSAIPMNAGEGYFTDLDIEETGNYSFFVTVKAACLDGDPESLEISRDSESRDYTLDAKWSANGLEMVSTLQKSSVVKVSASLLDSDKNKLTRGKYLTDGGAALKVEADGKLIDTIPAKFTGDALEAEWRISKSGEIKLTFALGDGSESSVSFRAVNHDPVLVRDKLEITTEVGKVERIKISDYVSDEDGDIFRVTSTGDRIDWSVDGDELVIDAGGHSADAKLEFTFDDGDVMIKLPARIRITNKKPEKTADIELPHFVLKAPGFMFFVDYPDEEIRFELDDYFADPEGLPLVYTLESATSDARLDGNTLIVNPASPRSERLKITATDSSDESVSVELRFNVDEWWTLNLKRFLIVCGVILAALVLITIIIRRESNIGYLRVVSANRGGELEINEKLNKRRIRLWSLGIANFVRNRVRGVDDVFVAGRESGRIKGHLIFGRKVTLVGCSADGYEKNGEVVEKKFPKKFVLRPGESVTLVWDDLRVTITNRN